MTSSLTTVIIPAAGLGTRLLPVTKSTPKELLPIYDRPAIQFSLDEAVAAGARHIIVVVGPEKGALRDYLGVNETLAVALERKGKRALSDLLRATGAPSGVKVTIVEQPVAKGLGDAVHLCAPYLSNAPFGVILPDDVIFGPAALDQMAQAYRGGHMVAAQMVKAEDVSGYGIFRPHSAQPNFPDRGAIRVAGMVEKPSLADAPSRAAAVGRYILDPAILGRLALTRPGAGGEIQLTDAISADAPFLPLTAFLFDGRRFDCGTHDGLLAASIMRRDNLRVAEPDLLAAE